MKDRVVQFPHRYQLVPVAGQENTYDVVAKPGVVTEGGTPINKASLLTDATAEALGLEQADPTVDDALNHFLKLKTESYMAFVQAVNADALDAAFGKGNPNLPHGLGNQLAMYAWYLGADSTLWPFTLLRSKNNLMDISNDRACLLEIQEYTLLMDWIMFNKYARETLFADIYDTKSIYSEFANSFIGTRPINITTEYLNDTEWLVLMFESIMESGFSNFTATISEVKLNNVILRDEMTAGCFGYVLNSDVLKTKYNITTPGTYNVEITLDRARSYGYVYSSKTRV